MYALIAVILAAGVTVSTTLPMSVGPDGGLETTTSARVTNFPAIQVTTPPNYSMSAFGMVRTASPFTAADLTNVAAFDTTNHFGVKLDGGSCVWMADEAAVVCTVQAGGYAAIQTHDTYRYQAGRGQRILQTFSLPGGWAGLDAGMVARWGYNSETDGIFWKASTRTPLSSALQFCIRTSTDGGVSESCQTPDAGGWAPENLSIWEESVQWLGVGTVNAFWNGEQTVTWPHANGLTKVYMASAQLPLMWEIQSTGTAPVSFKMICSSVYSEGGSPSHYHPYAASRITPVTVNASTTNVPLLSLRPAATYNTRANRAQLYPKKVWCYSTAKLATVRVMWNVGTLTGAAFAAPTADSAAQIDQAASAADGGTEIGSFGVASGASFEQDVSHIFSEDGFHARRRAFYTGDAGTGHDTGLDTITLLGTNVGNGNTDMQCGVEWSEVY